MKRIINYKKFIVCLCLVAFLSCSIYQSKKVEAYSMSLTGGISFLATGTTVTISAPVVAAILSIALAMGIYFNNQDEVNSFVINLYNKSVSAGKDIFSYFKESMLKEKVNSDGSVSYSKEVSINSEGVNSIYNSIVSSEKNTTLKEFNIPLTFDSEKLNGGIYYGDSSLINVKQGILYHYVVTPNFLINSSDSLSILGINYVKLALGSYIFASIDGKSPSYHLFIDTTGTYTKGDATIAKLALLNDSTYKSAVSSNTLQSTYIKNGMVQSISTNPLMALKYTTTSNFAGSLSLDFERVFGDVIGNTESVSADGFLDNSISKDKDISVSIPTTSEGVISLDSVINKTYDDVKTDGLTIENTNTVDIPDTGVDEGVGEDAGLFDWLKSLINSIIDFLKSILNSILAIPSAILSFFVIDWDLVADHIVFDEIFKNKFKPFYDVAYLLQNINANPSNHSGKFYMVIPPEMGGDGLEHCVLDLTIANDFIVIGRSFINASIWIGFLWYILKLFSPNLNIG